VRSCCGSLERSILLLDRGQIRALASQIYLHSFEALDLCRVMLSKVSQLCLKGGTTLEQHIVFAPYFGRSGFQLHVFHLELVKLRV
jgi:hypothetical protein